MAFKTSISIASLKGQGLNYLKNERVKQALLLFSVNIITIPVGLVISIIFSHYLGANRYGDYQFMDNVFTFSVLIFTFGFFQAANRALVLNNNPDKAKQYFGATLVILGGLFLLMSVALLIYSYFDVNLKAKHLDKFLLYSIPFGWVYLALSYFETLFQADNRINLLAIARALPKIGLLASAIAVYLFLMNKADAKLEYVWGAYISTQAIVYLIVLYKIKLSFKDIRSTFTAIWNYNKSYGIHVYVGTIFGVGVSQLTGILISYFGQNNSGVGYYALALSLAAPLQFIPNTIATTNYRKFAVESSIPKKLTQFTFLLTILSLVAIWIIVPIFVINFYSSKFRPVIYMNFVVSLGIACYGMADYYNRFLGAHGHGKLLRDTSLIVGVIILVCNFILIPRYGANGASIARLIGGIGYLLCMFYYYRKTRLKQ